MNVLLKNKWIKEKNTFSGRRWKHEKSSDSGTTWTQDSISDETDNCPNSNIGFSNRGDCAGKVSTYIYDLNVLI